MKVIITGMHRSGTSMVAGLLQYCGLYLGNNLLGPGKTNSKGHFEDKDFLALNISILKKNRGDWNSPPAHIKFKGHRLKKDMMDFLDKWPQDKIVGFKDPRTCLTLKLWKEIIDPAALKIVVVYRPFEEIMESLRIRNKFSPEKSMKLSFYYMKALMKNLEGLNHIPTYYHEYFKNWEKELTRVCNFLGLKIPRSAIEIKEFIDESLWHCRSK